MLMCNQKVLKNSTTRVIHQLPDASKPSKYKSYLLVYPSGSCRRRAHLRLQGTPIYWIRATIAARDKAGHFTHVELAVFFPSSTKCKSIATVHTCVWQQIQVSKRLVPVSPFTCYTFHGFATRLSGCIIYKISCLFSYHLDYMETL